MLFRSTTAGTAAEGTVQTEAKASDEKEAPVKLKLFLTNKNIVDGSYAKKMIEEATNTELEIIQVPTKDLDNKNAVEEVERWTTREERQSKLMELLGRMLDLDAPPRRIESYDISNQDRKSVV